MPPIIDLFSLSAKLIEICFEGQKLADASAFTWATEDAAYLITNWHNVTGKNPITGKHLSIKTVAEPNTLLVHLDLVNLNGSRGSFPVRLYDQDDQPTWLEHPLKAGIDVVAIPLPPVPGAHLHPINMMAQRQMAVRVGMDAFVIGYPFGAATGMFPIWKRASIASEPQVPIAGMPYFLVDSASRRGMSGSPVVERSWGTFQSESGGSVLSTGPHDKFLGVYAGRVDDKEDQAQIGRVWHASVIDQIIDGQRRGSKP